MLTNQKSSFLKNNRLHNYYHKPAFMRHMVVITGIAWITVLGTSCGNVKNLQYLQGSFDTLKLSKIQLPETRIQKGDLLSIAVYSDNAAATAAVTNQMAGQSISTGISAGSGATSGTTVPGYLVDDRGNIQLFKLGVLPAEGMTQKQLADTLAILYVRDSLLRNPYIEVRLLNYKVTLLGEVNRPGSYTMPANKLSAFEAIGLAGDITPYGRKDNVMVIRETNGIRQFGHLDLGKPDVFLSPYYYLQQNDMIIVDVSKTKGAVNDQTTIRNISIATSIISTIAIVYSILRN
jgi:polysaccharide export outer membrane protein